MQTQQVTEVSCVRLPTPTEPRTSFRRRKKSVWSRNYAEFMEEEEGRYEFERYGLLVRGRQVRSLTANKTRSITKFLPIEFWDIRTNTRLYLRSPDNDRGMYITRSRIRGDGTIFIPNSVPVSDDLANDLQDMTQVIQAALTDYAIKALEMA